MGILFVVATPIGNLNDISKRALDTLRSVDIILCEDTRHSLKLLNHYDIKNKLISYHKFNEKERTNSILTYLKDNKDIAIITDAGTPCISDPGYILIKEAKSCGVDVIGVGGISAVITALSVSGISSDYFSFYGFFPRETKDKKELVNKLNSSDIKTFIFYESPKRIIKTLEFIFMNFGDVMISVSSDLTKIHEKNYFGRLSVVLNELKDNPNSSLGEYTFVFEKNDVVLEKDDLSIEAMLIDIIVKENVSLKDAISILNKENTKLSKKDIYNASLNIKNVIKGND